MGLQPLNKVIDYGRMHCFFPFYYLSRIVQFTCWQGRMCTLRILVVHIAYFWFNSNTEAAPLSCCKTCSPRTNSLLAKLVKRSRERRPTWMPYPIMHYHPPPTPQIPASASTCIRAPRFEESGALQKRSSAAISVGVSRTLFKLWRM